MVRACAGIANDSTAMARQSAVPRRTTEGTPGARIGPKPSAACVRGASRGGWLCRFRRGAGFAVLFVAPDVLVLAVQLAHAVAFDLLDPGVPHRARVLEHFDDAGRTMHD